MAKKFIVRDKKLKVYINRKPVPGPWGGGNLFVRSMFEILPRRGFENIENPFQKIPPEPIAILD